VNVKQDGNHAVILVGELGIAMTSTVMQIFVRGLDDPTDSFDFAGHAEAWRDAMDSSRTGAGPVTVLVAGVIAAAAAGAATWALGYSFWPVLGAYVGAGALTVVALTVDQRLAGAGGDRPALAVTVRAGRRAGMYLYLFALTTQLLAADRETLDPLRGAEPVRSVRPDRRLGEALNVANARYDLEHRVVGQRLDRLRELART
jgi:hypothetical protein